MSYDLMNLVWPLDLPSREKLLLLALADSANSQGECFHSIAKLAVRASLNNRSVYRALNELEALNHITRKSRPGSSTIYVVHPTSDSNVTPDRSVTTDTDDIPPLTNVSHPPLTLVSGTPDRSVTHKQSLNQDSRRGASGASKTSSVRDPAGEEAPDESTLDKALFAEGRKVFGKSCGGLINRAIRDKGKPFVVELIERCKRMDPEQARAYLSGAILKQESRGFVA